jgi:hypothetical protein
VGRRLALAGLMAITIRLATNKPNSNPCHKPPLGEVRGRLHLNLFCIYFAAWKQ